MLDLDYLADLYQSNKDVAVMIAGGAYPAGRFLLWAGGLATGCGRSLVAWALTRRPEAPLDEAVAVLVEQIGKATKVVGEVDYVVAGPRTYVRGEHVQVTPPDLAPGWGNARPVPADTYRPHERRAIARAYKARFAELKEMERQRLREAAAVG